MGREEDRGIRSAKLSPSFSHVVRLRVGGEIVGNKGRQGGRFARGDNRMEQQQQFVTLISQPTNHHSDSISPVQIVERTDH